MMMLSKFLNFPNELSENDELREFELSGSDCNYTRLDRFGWASMQMDKFYHTQPIQPGINVNRFPPNLITCACTVNVKLINTHVPGFYWTMAPRPNQIHSFSMYLSRLSISRVYSLHTPSLAFLGTQLSSWECN